MTEEWEMVIRGKDPEDIYMSLCVIKGIMEKNLCIREAKGENWELTEVR